MYIVIYIVIYSYVYIVILFHVIDHLGGSDASTLLLSESRDGSNHLRPRFASYGWMRSDQAGGARGIGATSHG